MRQLVALSKAQPIPSTCPHEVKPATYLGAAHVDTLNFHRGTTCGSTNIRGPFYVIKGPVGTKTNSGRVLLVRSWFCRDCQENGEQIVYGQATDPAIIRAVGQEALLAAGALPEWYGLPPKPKR